MSYILVKNAHILDPSCGREELGCILIKDSKIVAYEGSIPPECEVMDAKGCLVIPGLIDFHTHIAYGLGDAGIHCDLMTLPNGITTAVDAGSTGTAAFDGFVRYVIPNCETRVKAFLHVSAIGVTTEVHTENSDPDLYDREKIRRLFAQYYPEHMLGLKLRLGRGFTKGQGTRPLRVAKEIAKELGCPLCVHVTDSQMPYGEILKLLEKGDILCHAYQGQGYTLLDQEGRVEKAALKAREQGVLFDLAAGRYNYDFRVFNKAVEQGFLPDIISTDTVSTSVYRHLLFHLLYVMSYCLDGGIPLMEVIRACTATPAAYMGLGGRIGTLQPGAEADIAILQIKEHPITYQDCYGNQVKGNHLFLPMATIKGGRPVYKRIEFEFWDA
ncbi:MAG: amidohydrolase family protein [Lachnospiraceae bacterium]|nr:amidohydrolase family protein [Lachnospiraceae bacterium]